MTIFDSIPRRLLMASALLAGLGPLVGNGVYTWPTGSGEKILAEVRDPLPTAAYVGFGLETLGLVALTVALAVLARAVATRSPIAAAVIAIAGGASVAVKIGSAAPLVALHEHADAANAGLAEVLTGMNDAAFAIFGLLFSLAFAAAGIGLLQGGGPRWLGWWAAVAGPLGIVTAGIGLIAPDAYVPIPFLLLLIWLVALAASTAFPSTRRSAPAIAVPVSQ